ncbi:Astacin-like metalloendopeptidase [Aphelenchoides besseyi]|nr:Astacin-like metalloendopeptidase [Aphelenchoides besseyi]
MLTSAMKLLLSIVLLVAMSSCTGKIVTYKLDPKNAISVNDCINAAMQKLRNESCVEFARGAGPDAIHFVDSGQCTWKEDTRTVHLSRNCTNVDFCALLIAHAVTNERPEYGASRHLNLKFNCTDKCTTICHNGGKVTKDCKCTCGYAFAGANCEKLQASNQFTDSSCGIINGDDKDEGEISLSTYPNAAPKKTFCQWLIKPKSPWATVEIEFVEFDGNFENRRPGTRCADTLNVYGARGIDNPLPCGPEFRSLTQRRFQSESDWVLIDFDTNNWSEPQHKGLLLKWRIINPKSNKDIRSYDPSANSANSIQNVAFTSVIFLFVSLFV